jgi:hypothetical protein
MPVLISTSLESHSNTTNATYLRKPPPPLLEARMIWGTLSRAEDPENDLDAAPTSEGNLPRSSSPRASRAFLDVGLACPSRAIGEQHTSQNSVFLC